MCLGKTLKYSLQNIFKEHFKTKRLDPAWFMKNKSCQTVLIQYTRMYNDVWKIFLEYFWTRIQWDKLLFFPLCHNFHLDPKYFMTKSCRFLLKVRNTMSKHDVNMKTKTTKILAQENKAGAKTNPKERCKDDFDPWYKSTGLQFLKVFFN